VRITQSHARYGWLYRPSQTYQSAFGGRTVGFAIDAESNRAALASTVPDHEQPTILFAGESVTAGQGLHYAETYPVLVGEQLKVQAVNLGVLGYASDQVYLRLIDVLPQYRHPVAVVTLFMPFMLSRNFQYWRDHLELDEAGRFVPVAAAAPLWTRSRLLHLLLDDQPYHTSGFTERSIALMRALAADTAARARAHGAYPLFVVPTYATPLPVERRPDAFILREVFDEQSLPYVLIDMDPDDYIAGDGHPNPKASALIADKVVAALRSAGVGR
jgi:hypothetical protein